MRTQFLARALADKVPALRDFVPVATTLHRLLNRTDTLVDALLVDECSMVDLPLMARLLDGLKEGTRLILLGDAGQLSSVEPGSVFSDLCATSDSATSPLAPCIVRLTKSHRFDPTSGIGRLAGTIDRGDAASAIAVLKDSPDTNLAHLADEAAFDRFARETAAQWAAHIEDSPASGTRSPPAASSAPIGAVHSASTVSIVSWNGGCETRDAFPPMTRSIQAAPSS